MTLCSHVTTAARCHDLQALPWEFCTKSYQVLPSTLPSRDYQPLSTGTRKLKDLPKATELRSAGAQGSAMHSYAGMGIAITFDKWQGFALCCAWKRGCPPSPQPHGSTSEDKQAWRCKVRFPGRPHPARERRSPEAKTRPVKQDGLTTLHV